MQVLLDRRRNYILSKPGKKPANIIPVIWHPTVRRIPKTLPKIEYQHAMLDPEKEGIWNLGDQRRDRELIEVADLIAFRVRDAADESPLPPLDARPRLNAVRSAFLPPPLPLPEFDSPDAPGGPDAVTFVYPQSARWERWPWAPPDEQAVLYLAAAAAKGNEMESTQLTFDWTDRNLASRLASLRRRNNVVILFLDVTSLYLEGTGVRMADYDRPEHSTFGVIVIGNEKLSLERQAKLNETLPYFARRAAPHLYIVDAHERFGEILSQALDGLKLAVVRDPRVPNVIVNATEFQRLPAINGPGRPQTVS
jgi:hypothetical protein